MQFEEGLNAQPKVLAQSALAVMGGLADVADQLQLPDISDQNGDENEASA